MLFFIFQEYYKKQNDFTNNCKYSQIRTLMILNLRYPMITRSSGTKPSCVKAIENSGLLINRYFFIKVVG